MCKCGNDNNGKSRYCKSCKSEYMRAWRKTHTVSKEQKKKDIARSYLNVYIKRGLIKREQCYICGSNKNIEAHHEDYSKPLSVVWLCRKHHLEHHVAIGQRN